MSITEDMIEHDLWDIEISFSSHIANRAKKWMEHAKIALITAFSVTWGGLVLSALTTFFSTQLQGNASNAHRRLHM